MKLTRSLVALCLSLSLSACGGTPEVLASSKIMSAATALEVMNPTSPEAGLLCSGMLTEAQFEQLAKDGYKSFINLRLPSEEGTGWEPEFAAGLDVEYVNMPIEGSTGITEANARAFAQQLAAVERPAVVYCGSSNRVGALYGLGAFYVDGASPEDALAKAKSAGVTRLEPQVRQLLGLSPAE